MKKTLLSTALVLGLFPVDYANANAYTQCSTGDTGACNRCTLEAPESSWFFGSHGWRLLCRVEMGGGAYVMSYGVIDDCVENREGKMGHGRGATQSCENFHLQGDSLHADCRKGDGTYLADSIEIGEYFDRNPVDSMSITCTQ